MDAPLINERATHLLKVLVERYLKDGQPVGSRTLSSEGVLPLSPATIRHILSDLEERGLIISPHTSAGRIPTAQGLRLFVDTMLVVKPLEKAIIEQIERAIPSTLDVQKVLAAASQSLSELSHMAGIITVPKREQFILRQLEFLPLSAGRILVIVVTNQHDVQNYVITPQRQYTTAELQQVANYINQHFVGINLSNVRTQLVDDLRRDKDDMNTLMQTMIDITDHVLQPEQKADYLLAGQHNLVGLVNHDNVDKLKQLFDTFTQKRDMLHLLDQCVAAQGVQIFIGEESGYTALDDCSVVTKPYAIDGNIVGVLGVIGPTRMDYQRVISMVDTTAKIVTNALNRGNESPY